MWPLLIVFDGDLDPDPYAKYRPISKYLTPGGRRVKKMAAAVTTTISNSKLPVFTK